MTAYNAVRFRVKPGMEQAFEDAHRIDPQFKGFRGGGLVKTGERSYCFIGSWDSMEALAAGRPQMLPILNSMRHMLEDLGNGLGVTDPVSGMAVVEFPASTA